VVFSQLAVADPLVVFGKGLVCGSVLGVNPQDAEQPTECHLLLAIAQPPAGFRKVELVWPLQVEPGKKRDGPLGRR
jgi:hypothetical protein